MQLDRFYRKEKKGALRKVCVRTWCVTWIHLRIRALVTFYAYALVRTIHPSISVKEKQ